MVSLPYKSIIPDSSTFDHLQIDLYEYGKPDTIIQSVTIKDPAISALFNGGRSSFIHCRFNKSPQGTGYTKYYTSIDLGHNAYTDATSNDGTFYSTPIPYDESKTFSNGMKVYTNFIWYYKDPNLVNKLISLDRLKGFLDKSKDVFFLESDIASTTEIQELVDSIMNPVYNYDGVYGPIPDENGMVDLSYYAAMYINNFDIITQIPQENLDYLNSGIIPTDTSDMFAGTIIQSINGLTLDTSKVTNMRNMFGGSSALSNMNWIIDMKSCDSFSVGDGYSYQNMLLDCANLPKIYIKNPPSLYYSNEEQFIKELGLTNIEIEIVS